MIANFSHPSPCSTFLRKVKKKKVSNPKLKERTSFWAFILKKIEAIPPFFIWQRKIGQNVVFLRIINPHTCEFLDVSENTTLFHFRIADFQWTLTYNFPFMKLNILTIGRVRNGNEVMFIQHVTISIWPGAKSHDTLCPIQLFNLKINLTVWIM